MEPTIRNAILDDVHAIASLHLVAWQQGYEGLIPSHVLEELTLEGFTTRWQERLLNPKPEEHILTAVLDEQIVGFVSFGDSRESMDLPQSFGEIYALYVHPQYWKKGAGRSLIQAAFKWFEENAVPGVFLWTLKENRRARTFYENVGMQLMPQERYITTRGVELLCCCYCNKSIL